MTGFCAQFLYVLFKSVSMRVLESFSLQISTWLTFVTKKKVKFVIHLHKVILKPQSKTFRHSFNFINYFQFWTTHYEWGVIIWITHWVSFGINKKKLQERYWKVVEPMEPCDAPFDIFVQLLYVLLIFIFCIR